MNRVDATGGSWSWIKNKASAVMEAARNAVEAVGNYLRSSRWSILPSKPDEIDWALMAAGATGDLAVLAATATGAAASGAAGTPVGCTAPGAAGGALAGYVAVKTVNAVVDTVATLRAGYGVWQGNRTIGDVILAVGGYWDGGSSAVLGWHTAMTTIDEFAPGGFYAQPSW